MAPKPDYAEIARLERELGLTDEQIIERGREARRKPRELTAAEATERLEQARKASTGIGTLAALQGQADYVAGILPHIAGSACSVDTREMGYYAYPPRLYTPDLRPEHVYHGFTWPVEHHDDIRHS